MAMTIAEGSSQEAGNATSHTFDVGTPASGDLVIGYFAPDTDHGGVSWGEGFNELFEDARIVAAYKFCDGTEGASIVVTTVNSQESRHHHWKISAGHHASQVPEVSARDTQNSDTYDPPSLTASWGNENNLFIAGSVSDGSQQASMSTFPSGYTDTGENAGNLSGMNLAWARKEVIATATDDAGEFVWDISAQGAAFNLVVRPASSAVFLPFFSRKTNTLLRM